MCFISRWKKLSGLGQNIIILINSGQVAEKWFEIKYLHSCGGKEQRPDLRRTRSLSPPMSCNKPTAKPFKSFFIRRKFLGIIPSPPTFCPPTFCTHTFPVPSQPPVTFHSFQARGISTSNQPPPVRVRPSRRFRFFHDRPILSRSLSLYLFNSIFIIFYLWARKKALTRRLSFRNLSFLPTNGQPCRLQESSWKSILPIVFIFSPCIIIFDL